MTQPSRCVHYYMNHIHNMNDLIRKDSNMYKSQEKLLINQQNIESWLHKYSPDHDSINWQDIEFFTIRVPLIGAFSAGKSTLLNRYLDDSLLPLNITPESGIAIELSYSEQDEVYAVNQTGIIKELSVSDLQSEQIAIEMVQKDAWLEARLNKTVLKNAPHITIVDLPGLGSGKDIHSKAIDEYITRSLAYCIVVSAEDGELSASTQAFLIELAALKLPIILIVTKADKRAESDVQQVFNQIKSSVEKVMGVQPLASLIVSRKNKEQLHVDVTNALKLLESKAESVFIQHVASRVIEQLVVASAQIQLLMNKEDLSSETLEVKRTELAKSLQVFKEQVEHETAQLELSCGDSIVKISNLVKQRILSQRDFFARSLLNGSDINDSLMQTVRLAVTEGITTEFLPKVRKYLEKIDGKMPEEIKLDVQFQSSLDFNNQFPIEAIGASIGGVLLPMLSKILVAIPFINILGPIIGLIAGWFMDKRKKESQRRDQFEEACSAITTEIVPKVMSEVESVLTTYLNEQIVKAKDMILKKSDEREQALLHTIDELKKQLAVSQEEFAQVKQGYQKDFDDIQTLLSQLS